MGDAYDVFNVMDLAATLGLSGVSIPLRWAFASLDTPPSTSSCQRVRDYALARGLFLVGDMGSVTDDELRALTPIAHDLGCRALRALVSNHLCGDRGGDADAWAAHLREVARTLRNLRSIFADYHLPIAIENHQDLTSSEMVWLCETVDSPWVGVTLDVVNPLAVVEDINAFAARVGPFIKNVHLKDYRLYATPQGYRLVRCPIGAGILNVADLFALLAAVAPTAPISLELAALEARHIRFLNADYWLTYPMRPITDVLPVLQLREQRKRPPGEDWRTPWERGEQGAAVSVFEIDQITQSLSYLHGSFSHPI